MITTIPITLEGTRVKLIPLSADHGESFKPILLAEKLYKLWYTSVPTVEQIEEEIKRRLAFQSIGAWIPFSVKDKRDGKICGMTSYMNIDIKNRRLEIGSTWLSKTVQRSGLNTQMKYLMLEHAFESFNCIAVEFRTHFMNHQSRTAIERLGAKLDGILRNHQIMPNNSLRDTCVYSITNAEWPAVKAHLNHLQSLHIQNTLNQ